MARSRIGIMGGSFNPIHRRHLQIAESALEEMKLDRVMFIPNGNPPHKHLDLTDAGHRFEMTRLAVIPYEEFMISDIEIKRDGVIYTADTLKLLHQSYPDANLIYIIGEDTLFELENWHHPLEVFRQCSFAVCMRKHQNLSEHPQVQALRAKGAVFYFLSLVPLDVSSSEIRRQIADGVFNDAVLTPEVCEYIRVMDLYGCSQSPAGSQRAYRKLSEALSDDRMLHSMAVAYTANRLARIHGLDIGVCELTGLLHDCAKCMSLETLRRIALDARLPLTELELSNVALLHGPVGAVIAETEYGVRQNEILSAISAHTTGRVGMSPIDTVIYLADKIEPYRNDIPALDEIRALADQNLYAAAYLMLQSSKKYVLKTRKPLYPATDEIIRWVHDQVQ